MLVYFDRLPTRGVPHLGSPLNQLLLGSFIFWEVVDSINAALEKLEHVLKRFGLRRAPRGHCKANTAKS